jgi:excinuclease UvrABC nuclease subunit
VKHTNSFLNIKKLPCLFLEYKKDFPEVACVYLICDDKDKIYYIGGTKNLKNRWRDHHKYNLFIKLNSPRLVYLNVSDFLIWDVEAYLINLIDPEFNRVKPTETGLIEISET